MRTFTRVAAALFLASAASACKFPPPEDVPDDAGDDAAGRAVGGATTGLWTGAAITLRLQAGDVDETVTASAAEPFAFTHRLTDGTSYLVSVVDDGPDHDCAVTNGSGRIDGADVTDLAVACTNLVPHGVAISTPIAFTFDPRVTRYPLAVSILQQEVSVTVTGATLTSAKVAGQAVTLGQPSPPVPLGPGMTTIDVDVVKGPISQRYQLVFDRGAAPIREAVQLRGQGDGDQFGTGVAMNDEYLAVGAPAEDSSNENGSDNASFDSGAVFIYRRNGASWTYLQTLKGSVVTASRGFGTSVSMSRDTLVVGAPYDDAQGTNAGAIYVFRLNDATGRWNEEQRLVAADARAYDRFGQLVAVDGDMLVASAPYHPVDGVTHAGQIYAFRRSGTVWSAVAAARRTAPSQNEGLGDFHLGFSDGQLVADRTDPTFTQNDFMSAFAWNGSAWMPVTVSPTAPWGAIAVRADLLLSTAPEEGIAGVINAYERNASGWMQTGTLMPALPVAGSRFGNGLALRRDLMVTTAGTALHAFSKVGGAWVATPPVPASGPPDDPQTLGTAAAVSMDGACIGSSRDGGVHNTGAVWCFQ